MSYAMSRTLARLERERADLIAALEQIRTETSTLEHRDAKAALDKVNLIARAAIQLALVKPPRRPEQQTPLDLD